MSTLIAGHNTATNGNLDIDFGYVAVGNAFTCSIAGLVMDSAVFNIYKTGTPTGSIYAKLFACSGAPGTTGTATGSALATSDAINATTVTTSANFTFSFSGSNRVSLSNATNYVIMLYPPIIDNSNFISVNFQNTPTSSYNEVYYTTSFSPVASQYPRFNVYGGAPSGATLTGIQSLTGVNNFTFS